MMQTEYSATASQRLSQYMREAAKICSIQTGIYQGN